MLFLESSVGEEERHRLNVLVDENRISIRIDGDKAGGTGRGFVGLRRVPVPAWIERQGIFFEHSLEQTDRVIAVPQYQPIL